MTRARPSSRPPMAQTRRPRARSDLVDLIGDGAAVLGAGVAVLGPPGLQDGLGRLAALGDAVEDGGGGGEAGGWGQIELFR